MGGRRNKDETVVHLGYFIFFFPPKWDQEKVQQIIIYVRRVNKSNTPNRSNTFAIVKKKLWQLPATEFTLLLA